MVVPEHQKRAALFTISIVLSGLKRFREYHMIFQINASGVAPSAIL
jgi:hypothetical protein